MYFDLIFIKGVSDLSFCSNEEGILVCDRGGSCLDGYLLAQVESLDVGVRRDGGVVNLNIGTLISEEVKGIALVAVNASVDREEVEWTESRHYLLIKLINSSSRSLLINLI